MAFAAESYGSRWLKLDFALTQELATAFAANHKYYYTTSFSLLQDIFFIK
jgi:hypothetical protein